MMSTVRRVFFYVLAIVTLGILSAGLRNLLSISFDTILAGFTIGQVGDLRQQLSLGIAMVIIGGPLWILFWSTIQRHAENDAAERAAPLRAFYLYFVLIVSAFITIFDLYTLLAWLLTGLGADQFNPSSTATLIVAAAVWFYHRHVAEKDGFPVPVAKTLWRWYVYILSATGLVWLSVGLVQTINQSFISLPVWQGEIVGDGDWNKMGGSLAGILAGGLTWTFFWFFTARTDISSSLRQVYFYLVTILGSAVAGLTFLIIAIYRTLFWFLGGDPDVVNYFQFLGWSLPAILVTFVIWFYHLTVAHEESEQQRRQSSAQRVHYYLMSFLGLGTLISGLIILLGIPLDSIINSLQQPVVAREAWWTDQLSLGITMIVVAIPIWLHYWTRIINKTETAAGEERPARSRRIYLYSLVGASVIMLAADLVNIVYQLLNGMLTDSINADTLRYMKWSLQTILIAIPVLVYHLGIARQDQKLGAEAATTRKNVTVLVSDSKTSLVPIIERKLGYGVRVSRYAGEPGGVPDLTDEDVDALVSQIQQAKAGNIMLVLVEGKTAVLPYE